MRDYIDSRPPKAGKRRERYLAVAGVALVLFVLVTGWFVHAARRKQKADVDAMIDMTPLAEGLGLEFDALGKGIENLGTELQAAAEFSRRFVADLAQSRSSTAYQATSQAFKQRIDEVRFTNYVQSHPDLKDETGRIDYTLVKKSANGTVRLTGNLLRGNTQPKSNVKLTIVDEDGGLKVDQMVLGDDKF